MEILREYEITSYSDRKNIGIWVGEINNLKVCQGEFKLISSGLIQSPPSV